MQPRHQSDRQQHDDEQRHRGNPGLFAVATVYEGGWISSYSTAYNVDQAAVSEDVSITVSDVFDISGSVYGEFIDSGLNAGDVTGRSIRYSRERG